MLKVGSISEDIPNHKCLFMKACIAYSLSAVLQSPVQSREGKLFDPLHFPDLTEHEALRISSLHLGGVGEQFGKLLCTEQQATKSGEKLLIERKSWEGEGWH